MKMHSNADDIAKRIKARAARLPGALRSGIRTLLSRIDRAQVENLAGSKEAAPGSYPVPNRTGDLMRGHGFKRTGAASGMVFNTSGHAFAVHEGRGSSAPYGRRPFLEDAAKSVDETMVIENELRSQVFTP